SVTFFARLGESVARLPGVRAVGLTTHVPLGDDESNQRSFRVDGGERTVLLPTYTIDDGYFASMSIPLIAGRGFARIGVQRDGDVIISKRAATTLWQDPTGNAAVGKQLAMSDVVRAATARLSFTLALMSAAALITLILGAIGLYGVLAYMVALRTREFGVRVALGAEPHRLARMVATRGLVLVAAGAGAG